MLHWPQWVKHLPLSSHSRELWLHRVNSVLDAVSSHTLVGMWLLIHAGIIVNFQLVKRAPGWNHVYLCVQHWSSWWLIMAGTSAGRVLTNLRSHVDGLVEDCSISSALALEILQSFTKPLICQMQSQEQTSMKLEWKYFVFFQWNAF